MLSLVLPFIVRHTATTTLVSTVTLVLTFYKFQLRRKKLTNIKNGAQSANNKVILLTLNKLGLRKIAPKRQEQLDTVNVIIRQIPLTSVITTVNDLANLRIEVKLRDLQEHIAHARQVLFVIDQWLGLVQDKVYQLQARLEGRPVYIHDEQRTITGQLQNRKLWFRRKRMASEVKY